MISVEVRNLFERKQESRLGPNSSRGTVEVDARGGFEFSGLPPGQWSVQARTWSGRASAHRTVTISSGGETSCPDLVLEPSLDLFCITDPGVGAVELDVLRDEETLGHLEVKGDSVGHIAVPAGRLHVIARRGDRIVDEQSLDAVGRGHALVGIGFPH
jgi:hypothetical protein